MNSKASTWGQLTLLVLLAAVLQLSIFLSPSTATAQGRVSDYVVEQFDGGSKWDWSAPYTYLGWSDNTYYSVSMPFAFSYDGNTVAASSTVRVSTNGWIQFTLPSYSPNGATTTYNQIGNSTYRNMIGVFAANMYPSGGIYHQTLGTSPNRTWTLSYASTRFQASSSYPYVSIELTLYEKDGTIEMRYSQPNLFMGSTAVNAGVGLNGHVVPNFQYRALENLSLDNTPARNWRMRPPRAAVPQLAVSVKSVDFGQALVGAAPQTACVTVTNVGTAGEPGAANTPLTFSGTSMNGTNDFTLTSNPSQSLYPGESKDYCVSFSAVNMGVLSAGLNIKTNGKDSGAILIPISAFGLAGKLELPVEQVFRKTKTKCGQALSQVIPIVNNGNYPMTVLSAEPTGEYADQYRVIEMPAGAIEPGATDTIKVSYDPIYEGLKMAELVVSTDAVFNPTDVVRMYGTGIIPRMTVTPGAVGIDSVNIGDTSYYTIKLSNVGTDTVFVRDDYFASNDPDFFYRGLIGRDSIIAPESSREVVVGFAPQTRGTRQARLRLLTNLPPTFEATPRDTSTFDIDFTTVAVPTGLLYVEGPTTLDSSRIGAEVCHPVTIWNNGEETLTVSAATLAGADAADFTISGVTFPLTIGAKGSTTVQVCATPSARGLRSAMITVSATSNGQTSAVDLPLAVYGQLVCAQPSTAIAFENEIVHVGEHSTAQILVNNCGDIATVYNATVSGAGYTLTSPAASSMIAPGGNHTFEVSFDPTSMAAMPGTLTITGANVDDMIITLGGIGGDVMIAAANNTAPATGVGVTSPEFTVTVTNNGNMDLTPGEPVISNSEFAYIAGSGPSTIVAGASADYRFTFTPSAEGARTAMVSFPSSMPLLSGGFALNGNGLVSGVHDAAINGYELRQSYPNPVHGSATITFTMAEAGKAQLVLSDVTGKIVMSIADRFFGKGENTVTFDASGLAAGTYFYDLITPSAHLKRSLMVSE
jgi:hypothetical protein